MFAVGIYHSGIGGRGGGGRGGGAGANNSSLSLPCFSLKNLDKHGQILKGAVWPDWKHLNVVSSKRPRQEEKNPPKTFKVYKTY
jgi:hypothetical protein